ncbi:MAG: hypothetical protein ICV66_03420 [Chitinophagaceae bacterium]|nr:hypothetical protein [Chitinophagaceae bacterium]
MNRESYILPGGKALHKEVLEKEIQQADDELDLKYTVCRPVKCEDPKHPEIKFIYSRDIRNAIDEDDAKDMLFNCHAVSFCLLEQRRFLDNRTVINESAIKAEIAELDVFINEAKQLGLVGLENLLKKNIDNHKYKLQRVYINIQDHYYDYTDYKKVQNKEGFESLVMEDDHYIM